MNRRPGMPRWVWPTVVVMIGAAVLVWTFTLYSDRGDRIIDGPASTVLVAAITGLATVLVVILQRTHTADHELRPNSGSSTKDQMNRVESMLQLVVLDVGDLKRDVGGVKRDVGGLRQENRNDRRADARRFAAVEQRIVNIEQKKGNP